MGRTRSSTFNSFGAAVLVLMATDPWGALSAEGTQNKIILVAEQDDEERTERLRSSIEAHLSDVRAEVLVHVIERLPSGVPDQVELARRLSNSGDILSVIWIEHVKGELFLFTSNQSSDEVHVQTLPHAADGWDVTCDAIGAMVRSALITWLDVETPPPAKDVPETLEVSAAPPPVETLRVQSRDPVRAVFGAGYSSVVLSRDGPFLSGGELGLGVLLFRYLEIGFSLRLLQQARLEIADEDIFLQRIPLALSAKGLMSFGAIEIGLELGVIVDITRLRGEAASASPDPTDRIYVGGFPAVFARYRFLDWLALWADAGVDIFRARHYTWDDERVLTYAAVQFQFAVGLSMILKIE